MRLRQVAHWLFAAGHLSCAACESQGNRWADPGVPAPQPIESRADPAAVDPELELRQVSARFHYEAARMERRLRAAPLQTATIDPAERACPADELSRLTEAQARLGLTTRDLRSDAKDLIPAQFFHTLNWNPIGRLRERSLRSEPASGALRLVSSLENGRVALAKLRELSDQRFSSVLEVSEYRPARVVYEIAKNRLQWIPGRLAGTLVVYGIDNGDRICGASIRVENSSQPRSTRRATREVTRMELERELLARTQKSVLMGLQRITKHLTLPAEFTAASAEGS